MTLKQEIEVNEKAFRFIFEQNHSGLCSAYYWAFYTTLRGVDVAKYVKQNFYHKRTTSVFNDFWWPRNEWGMELRGQLIQEKINQLKLKLDAKI